MLIVLTSTLFASLVLLSVDHFGKQPPPFSEPTLPKTTKIPNNKKPQTQQPQPSPKSSVVKPPPANSCLNLTNKQVGTNAQLTDFIRFTPDNKG